MKNLTVIMAVLLVVALTGVCRAEIVGGSKTIPITAKIDTQTSGMDISVSKVTVTDCTGANDKTWNKMPTLTMPMGTLGFDTRNGDNVFRTGTAPNFTDSFYFAVDVGVIDNSGRDWYITHTPTTIRGSVSGTLDSHVNVAFTKVSKGTGPGGTDVVTDLEKKVFGSSTKTINKGDLGTQWLRVYYGVASGIGPTTANPNNCVRDAADASPITLVNTPAGDYSGSVTLSLTYR